MDIFKSGSLAWWQIGILKVSVFTIGIAVGANWPEAFRPYTGILILIGIVAGLYVATAWYKK